MPSNLTLVAVLTLATAARADAPTAAEPSRAVKVGASFSYLVSNPFSGASSAAGAGIAATYEFILSPHLVLGIEAGYRLYPGDQTASQLVYGVLIKHYLARPAAFRPYLQYGLLQDLTRRHGHTGAAVSYDAGLMAGSDFGIGGAPLFAEAAFHFSHLSWFDVEAQNASYLELVAGARFTW